MANLTLYISASEAETVKEAKRLVRIHEDGKSLSAFIVERLKEYIELRKLVEKEKSERK